MLTRSGDIKKRHGIGRGGKKQKTHTVNWLQAIRLPRFRLTRAARRPFRFPVNRRTVNRYFFRLCVLAGVIALLFGAWQLLRPGRRIRVDAATVAAFQMPHRAIGLLEFYAYRHNIYFPELLVIFNAENNFFPDKSVAHDLSVIEALYAVDFHKIKRRYNARSLAPYIEMFSTLFNELEVFPIPTGWYEDEPSVMFGDSWGIDHNMQGNRMHMGTAIVDRENIRGRVPVVSMTHGRIEEAGWNSQLGYFVGITTVGGTYYLYAHLERLAPGLRAGQTVSAGQSLGYMGNSGGGRGGGNFPVHLHIGISPEAGFTRGRFWLNPYPLLRHLEARM